ncbi:MAG: pseudouridine synthase [Flavipsychrobacter sp.]
MKKKPSFTSSRSAKKQLPPWESKKATGKEEFSEKKGSTARRRSGTFSPKEFSEQDKVRKEKPSFEKREVTKDVYRGRRPEKKFEPMPLNKYLAHSGLSSRREAAEIIKEGKVLVNGKVMKTPGYRVLEEDKVTMSGKELKPQKDLVYILLNKPKDYITTTDDPKNRKTVMALVMGVEQRVYPVGRLDRQTTGLLLLTNDGDLAQKLSHPKYNIKKIYQVTLDKQVTKAHFDEIMSGLELEDGPIQVDALAYLANKNEIGLEIHSGRNRIVRRIFEHLGYNVTKLDRVMYAGLTKKNIPRGKWRQLNEKEVIRLKHFKS